MQAKLRNSSGETILFNLPKGFTIVFSGYVQLGDKFLVVPELDLGRVSFKSIKVHDIGTHISKFRLVIRFIGDSDES